MDRIMSQPWMNSFEGAFCEFDRKKLIERIVLAKAAIDGRLHDLQNDSSHHDERHLMTHALRTLTLLRASTSEVGPSREEEEEDDESAEPELREEVAEGYSE